MHGGSDDENNGSKAVCLLLRLANLALALTSAVVMATASASTTTTNGAAASVSYKDYPPFVYLVWANIAASVLASAGIYLQLAGNGDDDGPKLPGILLTVFDVAVQALLYSATGAVFAASSDQVCGGGGRFCGEVNLSKLFALGASFTFSLAAVAKDVSLPFSVWPASSD